MIQELLTIDHLGARGDGVALTPEGTVFVPYALPQEQVWVERDKDAVGLIRLERASRERRTPPCPLFTQCGGCMSQHMSEALVHDWKIARVTQALQQAGLEGEIAHVIHAHGEGRRLVTWHVRHVNGQLRAGLMAARTHTLIPIERCPILHRDLQTSASVAVELGLALKIMDKPLDVQITTTHTGLDVDIRGLGEISDSKRQSLITHAMRLDVARVSIHGALIMEQRAPLVRMGRVDMPVAPASFLQATAAGEEALAERVCAELEGAKRVADLFAGCGPFTVRLAERSSVQAFESHAPALKALERAIKSVKGLKPITVHVRDLFRRPLLPLELKAFDAVVLDPPRAGAIAQVTQIALARVPRVMMVSCDAATFARDAAILVKAGYTLGKITLVDQFIHSPHVELACLMKLKRK